MSQLLHWPSWPSKAGDL